MSIFSASERMNDIAAKRRVEELKFREMQREYAERLSGWKRCCENSDKDTTMTTEEVRWMLQAADLRIERDLRDIYGKPSPGVTADEAKDAEAVRMVFAILNSFMTPRCRSAFVTRVAEAVAMADGRVA